MLIVKWNKDLKQCNFYSCAHTQNHLGKLLLRAFKCSTIISLFPFGLIHTLFYTAPGRLHVAFPTKPYAAEPKTDAEQAFLSSSTGEDWQAVWWTDIRRHAERKLKPQSRTTQWRSRLPKVTTTAALHSMQPAQSPRFHSNPDCRPPVVNHHIGNTYTQMAGRGACTHAATCRTPSPIQISSFIFLCKHANPHMHVQWRRRPSCYSPVAIFLMCICQNPVFKPFSKTTMCGIKKKVFLETGLIENLDRVTIYMCVYLCPPLF